VKALSRAIVAELQRHTAVTTFHLSTFCRQHERLGINRSALQTAITRRGGEVITSKLGGEEQVPTLLQRTYEAQWMHLFYADALARTPGNAAVASHVKRNGFWYPEEPHFDDEVVDAVVEALFEPICRDYQRVATEIQGMPATASVTAHELIARLPGTFLRDIEDALDDLTDRGVLARTRDSYRWANGRRDLTEYRNECAWQGLHSAAR
jgi:alcohol-forming fatty acyl-CoA reductase